MACPPWDPYADLDTSLRSIVVNLQCANLQPRPSVCGRFRSSDLRTLRLVSICRNSKKVHPEIPDIPKLRSHSVEKAQSPSAANLLCPLGQSSLPSLAQPWALLAFGRFSAGVRQRSANSSARSRLRVRVTEVPGEFGVGSPPHLEARGSCIENTAPCYAHSAKLAIMVVIHLYTSPRPCLMS